MCVCVFLLLFFSFCLNFLVSGFHVWFECVNSSLCNFSIDLRVSLGRYVKQLSDLNVITMEDFANLGETATAVPSLMEGSSPRANISQCWRGFLYPAL